MQRIDPTENTFPWSFLTCKKEIRAQLPAEWRTSATYRAFFLDARRTHRIGEDHRGKKNWFVPNFILPRSLVVQQRTQSISKYCETCQRPVLCQFSSVLRMRMRSGRARGGAGLTCPGGCFPEKEGDLDLLLLSSIPFIPLHRLCGADCWEPSSVALPRWVIKVHRPESLFGTIDILFTFFFFCFFF